jgi:hypothetical protein
VNFRRPSAEGCIPDLSASTLFGIIENRVTRSCGPECRRGPRRPRSATCLAGNRRLPEYDYRPPTAGLWSTVHLSAGHRSILFPQALGPNGHPAHTLQARATPAFGELPSRVQIPPGARFSRTRCVVSRPGGRGFTWDSFLNLRHERVCAQPTSHSEGPGFGRPFACQASALEAGSLVDVRRTDAACEGRRGNLSVNCAEWPARGRTVENPAYCEGTFQSHLRVRSGSCRSMMWK